MEEYALIYWVDDKKVSVEQTRNFKAHYEVESDQLLPFHGKNYLGRVLEYGSKKI